MDPDQVFVDENFHQDEEAKPFIEKFADYSAVQLTGIITKYISYEPGAVMAALYLSVQKGLISYDLKEQLWNQIETNFKRHKNHIRAYDRGKNNAFIKYVSSCTDDQIYDIIEKPGDIVIDVYFAVLMVATERELISAEDFDLYRQDAESGIPHEQSPNFSSTSQSPFSGATQFQEVSEHPGRAYINNEMSEAEQKRKGLIGPGFSLLVIGIFIAFYEYNRTYHSSFAQHTRFLDVGAGIFIATAGLIVLLFGIWKHLKKDND